MAVTFKTQQAGPLMQQGVFLAVFLSTAYTPQPLLRAWLAETAGLNPVTHVLELARQATVVGIEPCAYAAGGRCAGGDGAVLRVAVPGGDSADGAVGGSGETRWL